MFQRRTWAFPVWLVILLGALIAVAPLLVHGCSCGHDFDFHLLSWFEASNQLTHGNLHPQWAVSPAYNAGEPRFVFYPPLSWYFGAALGLLLTHLPGVSESAGWNAAPMLFTWSVFALPGWTMYRLAREFVGVSAATLAAVLYLANPYMLFTAFERSAYAELLAAAWMPLLLHAILRKQVTLPRIAVPLALLWLTNAPAAVIGTYTLALLGAMRVGSQMLNVEAGTRWIDRLRGSVSLVGSIVAGTAVGLMVAAFYLVPAAYERHFVQIQMAVIPGMRVQDNSLFHHTQGTEAALHDAVLHTASVIATALAIIALVALAIWKVGSRKQTRRPSGVRFSGLVVLTLAVLFVLTPWSAMFWKYAPEATFLQFPWRATLVLAAVAALSCAGLASTLRLEGRKVVRYPVALLLCIPLAWPAYSAFHQFCEAQDTPDARLAVFRSGQGSGPTDEYTPNDADNDILRQNDPPYWIAAQANDPAPTSTSLLPGPVPQHIELRTPRAADLVLNLRAYPAWEVLLDGAPDLQRIQRDDGLLAFPIPSGASVVEVRWIRTPDQKIGDIATLLGLGLLTASILPASWRTRVRT